MRDRTDGEHTPPNEIVSNVKDSLDDLGSSRRSFLAGTGALLGAGAFSGTALAGCDDDGGEKGDGNGGDAGMDEVTDVDVLNYALTLEHLEDVFYEEAVASFDEETVVQSEAAQPFGEYVTQGIYDNIARIGRHEETHVEALTATIEELGGEPVPECTYEFGYSDFNQFLAIAQTLENTGVAAYNGAIALIDEPALVTTGATIATVEARHASYLNLLNQDIPFQDAFDPAKSMDEILEAAGGFIVECPDGMEMEKGMSGSSNGSNGNGSNGNGYGDD